MNNVGKIFEDQFKKYVPDYCLLYRIPDPPSGFLTGLRFSIKNPFDFLIWDSKHHKLFALELKTVKGSSISFERSKEESRVIHFHQIAGLEKWSQYNGIVAGFIIEFRQLEKTVFLSIDEFKKLIKSIDKNSFNYKDLEKHNIKHRVIEQTLMKKNYKYNIKDFIESFEE